MTNSGDRFGLDRLIDRPALRFALDAALDKRLTLIVAQAGAGKTTLLRQWCDSHDDCDFAFLDITAADDDPAHFTRRILAALAVVNPAVSRISRSISSRGTGLNTHTMETLAMALESVPGVVIVIDNVERFSNVRLVADLGALVARVPHNVHVLLSSRFDPPIALSKYRLDDELLELRQAELAFNDDESADLLNRVIGHSLTPPQVRALRERTEGWAAGLQLAGLGLRHESDADAFIAEFGGSDRLVADYLGEEVLSILPAERRNLLLQASALDDMCAGLVEAVSGADDAQSFLEELERESMFLVPLDARREWFRFHHLFCELLRSRLRAENPAGELRVLTRAAHWHLERGRVKPAMEYLLRAQAWDEALGAMLPDADSASQGDMTVAHWTPSLPESSQSARVNAEMLAEFRHAVGHHLAGQRTAARPASEDLPGSVGGPSSGLGFVAAQVLWRARPEVSTAAARRRLDELEASDSEQTDGEAPIAESSELASALVAGGRAYFLAGDTEEARRWLLRGLVAAASDVVERLSALSALSLVEAWCGNIEQADTRVRDALRTAREAGLLAHPSLADAYLASVLTALDRDEPTRNRPADDRQWEAAVTSPGEARTLAPTALFERVAELLSSGDTEEARDIVSAWDQLVPEPEALSVVQRHLLGAWIAVEDDAPFEVTRQLTEAVKIAEIYGFVDVFIRCGPIILNRLSTISGPQAAFSDIIRVRAQRTLTPRPVRELPDPLTDRELEILAYLPTRFTNVELARRCFVSVNTIKTHMAHIYRKLDATNRDTAISRAREFGLL